MDVTTGWIHLNGAQQIDRPINATLPHPSGLDGHTMILNRNKTALLVFGGTGYIDQVSSYGKFCW